MKYLVVTPSVRQFPYEYFMSIQGKADHLIVEDGRDVDRSGLIQMPGVVYANDAMITEYLGGQRNRNLIPSGNPSCKNFGLLYGFREGYDVIILLDDDCNTMHNPSFMDDVPVGKTVEAVEFHTFSGWYNTLEQIAPGRGIYARGYPYEFRGEPVGFNAQPRLATPVFNEGLWTQTPDINGVDKLQMLSSGSNGAMVDMGMLPPWYIHNGTVPNPKYVVLQQRQRLPLSIMNCQIARRAIPAFWQPPDFLYGPGWRVRRHDDVWSAMFLKYVVDRMGESMTVGAPMIRHEKAGDMNREILSEHPTNLVQYHLMRLMDQADFQSRSLMGGDYTAISMMIADQMVHLIGQLYLPGHAEAVLNQYAKGTYEWASLFL